MGRVGAGQVVRREIHWGRVRGPMETISAAWLRRVSDQESPSPDAGSLRSDLMAVVAQPDNPT